MSRTPNLRPALFCFASRLFLLMTTGLLTLVILPDSGSCAGEKASAAEEARQVRELVYQLRHRIEALEQQQVEKKKAESEDGAKVLDNAPRLSESAPNNRMASF